MKRSESRFESLGRLGADKCDATRQRGRAVAEGGAALLHLEANDWKRVNLSIVPVDPDDPIGEDDLSKVFLAHIRIANPSAPLDIFPKPKF